jgi:hypothetical protein
MSDDPFLPPPVPLMKSDYQIVAFCLTIYAVVLIVGLGVIYGVGAMEADAYRTQHHCVQLFGTWFATEQLTDRRYCS